MKKVILVLATLMTFSLGGIKSSAEEVEIIEPELSSTPIEINEADIDGLKESLEPNEFILRTGRAAQKNGISGQVHLQQYGWQRETDVKDTITVGSTGRGLRLETMKFYFWKDGKRVGSINYQSHVQTLGWLGSTQNGGNSGTTGRGLRMEALKIYLSGSNTRGYSVKYRVHVAKKGWLNWTTSGNEAGTTGERLQIEAIQVALVGYA